MQDETIRRYVGYCPIETLPFKRGDVVTIPKGTKIHSTNPSQRETVAGRAYKVAVHHLLPGMTVSPSVCHYNRGETPGHKSNPKIVWAGSGGYWCEADIADVYVQSVTYEFTTAEQLFAFCSECAKHGIRTAPGDNEHAYFVEVFGLADKIDIARGLADKIDPA